MTGMTPESIGDSGYTLEDLAAYHDRGRQPAIPAIDGDAQCRAVLDSMDRLGALSRELVERDAELPLEESWFEQIIGEVARESRAGRDLPIAADDVHLVVTEGAVRGLVRDAGDAVSGVLVERVEVEVDDDRVDVALTISVLHGHALPTVADLVRRSVHAALTRSASWEAGAIDITIDSLRVQEEER